MHEPSEFSAYWYVMGVVVTWVFDLLMGDWVPLGVAERDVMSKLVFIQA